MKVKKLIERLKKFDPESEIQIWLEESEDGKEYKGKIFLRVNQKNIGQIEVDEGWYYI